MRKVKHQLMAAVVAVSALVAGATPRPAAAEVPAAAEAAAQLADGWYAITDMQNGLTIAWFHVTNNTVDDFIENPFYQEQLQQWQQAQN